MNLAVLALTALPFVVSPGASLTLTVHLVAEGDHAAAVKVWSGTAAGLVGIAVVGACTGLTRVVAHDGPARTVLGVAGGAVLLLMGVVAGARAVRQRPGAEVGPRAGSSVVGLAFVAVVLNVKALTLYLVVVPTLPHEGTGGLSLLLTFAAVHLVLLLAWLSTVSLTVRAVPRLATSARARRCLLLVTATTLVVLGGRSMLDGVLGA